MAHALSQEPARVDFRTTRQTKTLIEQAAALNGMTVSEFAKSTLLEKAQQVIENHEMRRLSDRDRDIFLDLIDNPPAPNNTLRTAATGFKKAIQEGTLRP